VRSRLPIPSDKVRVAILAAAIAVAGLCAWAIAQPAQPVLLCNFSAPILGPGETLNPQIVAARQRLIEETGCR
jgi:hypothetical protein